jgi:transcriptional regulator with XRE-family HTH domain
MLSVVKTEERQLVRRLRQEQGLSVRELATAVGVSKSSVSLWVRGIELTDAQVAALRDRNPAYNGQRLGAQTRVALGRARRAAHQEEGRARVRAAEEEFIRACLLYWAEGAKSRHSLSFSNADGEMVRLWMDALRSTLGAPESRIRLTCYLYADHLERQRAVEDYWLNLTRLHRSNLCRSIVNNYSRGSQRKRTNMLPYGTAKIAVHDTRLIQMVLGGIQEIGGFRRDAWLE